MSRESNEGDQFSGDDTGSVFSRRRHLSRRSHHNGKDNEGIKPGSIGRHIVVGVDGSQSSVEALGWAACLAERMDADVAAITTWPDPIGWNDDGWVDHTAPQEEAIHLQKAALQQAFGRTEWTG